MDQIGTVSPLKIANEGFLVAATIERCPRQMMLRELVMNAVEASAGAEDGEALVRIGAREIDGVPKLCIWNTGRGLSQEELLKISDLSSSLFKSVGLDGNFGMGAKVASLTSNKLGLRYRSCKDGKVSQIILGQRNGIYGRLVQREEAGSFSEVLDVTDVVKAEALRDLSKDWTEVLLMGNSAEQNTVTDPYDGDPAQSKGWVEETLGHRFLKIDPRVRVRIEPEVTGNGRTMAFAAEFSKSIFDRITTVTLEDGVKLHYAYRDPGSDKPASRFSMVGIGMVGYRNEVYALTPARRWALEAPTYGFTFAARNCSVLVELPESYPVHAEQYRQFLRFSAGDQRQVQVADFGEIIRENIPAWLKAIIASMMPDNGDYISEIKEELQQLMAQLGITDQTVLTRKPAPKAEPVPDEAAAEDKPETVPPEEAEAKDPKDKPEKAKEPPPPPAPRQPRLPTPPEIILVDDDEDIIDKGLGGRVARFYPNLRQLFVNARYTAFARMTVQLTEEFADLVDRPTAEQQAKLTAEWAIVRRLTRALAYSLGKAKLGWSSEDVKRVQSPEALSLLVDDVDALIMPARARLAAQLGLELGTGQGGGGLLSFGGEGESAAQRAAADLADAEARLQRAMSANVMQLAPYYRAIASILTKSGNFIAAREWLDKGKVDAPSDPLLPYQYAAILMAEGDLDGAAEQAKEALDLSLGAPNYARRLADIEWKRGNGDASMAILDAAVKRAPNDPRLHFELSTYAIYRGDFDAAATHVRAAQALSDVPNLGYMRRLSDIERRRGNIEEARRHLNDALEFDKGDTSVIMAVVNLARSQGDLAGAVAEIQAYLDHADEPSVAVLRKLSEIELQLAHPAEALAAANRAALYEPKDPLNHYQRSVVFMAVGDYEGALGAVEEAISLTEGSSITLLRRKAMIFSKQRNYAGAAEVLESCIAENAEDASLWLELAVARVAKGDLDGAEAALAAGEPHLKGNPMSYLRRRADLAFRRGNSDQGMALLNQALASDPSDYYPYLDLCAQLAAKGALDEAAEKIATAISLIGNRPSAHILRKAADLDRRRGNLAGARAWLQRSMDLYPEDPANWMDLSVQLTAEGALEEAQAAVEKALALTAATRAKLQIVVEEALPSVA